MITIEDINNAEIIPEVIRILNEISRSYSTRPDITLFPECKEGDIIDEEKSVKWNREEVERRIQARDAETRRLRHLKAELVFEAEDKLLELLSEDTSLNKKQIKLIWNYAYDEAHSGGYDGVLDKFDEIRELVEDVIANA